MFSVRKLGACRGHSPFPISQHCSEQLAKAELLMILSHHKLNCEDIFIDRGSDNDTDGIIVCHALH